MGSGEPVDQGDLASQTPNSVRADRFGGPVLVENAEFSTSGFFSKKCELRGASGKVVTLRGNVVRFRDGSKLSFEVYSTGVRPRHGRTVLVDLQGNVRATTEWAADAHYFQISGGDCTYTVDRADHYHWWQIHGDGVVAEFDHHKVEVAGPVPVIVVLLAWKVARTLERLPGMASRRAKAWNRPDNILGS